MGCWDMLCPSPEARPPGAVLFALFHGLSGHMEAMSHDEEAASAPPAPGHTTSVSPGLHLLT